MFSFSVWFEHNLSIAGKWLCQKAPTLFGHQCWGGGGGSGEGGGRGGRGGRGDWAG